MKRGFKYIEHEKYSAPTKVLEKVDGKWTYERLTTHVREFRQRVQIRLSAMSIAKRWAPYALEIHESYHNFDAYVRKLLTEGVRNSSNMAKKKFYAHRPKPADNRAKNAARRAVHQSWQIANEPPMKSSNHVNIPITNAAQVRLVAAMENRRGWRSWCGDRAHGRRNHNTAWNSPGGGARECARRRRQMGLA